MSNTLNRKWNRSCSRQLPPPFYPLQTHSRRSRNGWTCSTLHFIQNNGLPYKTPSILSEMSFRPSVSPGPRDVVLNYKVTLNSKLYRPMSPVLTQNSALHPTNYGSLQSHLSLRPVTNKVIIDPPTPDVKRRPPCKNATDAPNVFNFLRSESPTPRISPLDLPPLFARNYGNEQPTSRKYW
ncbi:hypothetical protein BKA83DRAFT_4125039 [Pisolithus microcarpus]|nr:hypothetical protein BKA83DRAFT_4125039 [Pisolithus microcarpus]